MISVLASQQALEAIAPLLDAYRQKGIGLRLLPNEGAIPARELLQELAEDSRAILVIGNPRRSPRTALPGPVIQNSQGNYIPLGWLPERKKADLRLFAQTAARVHQRADNDPVVAILGQWHRKYLKLARRIETLLKEGDDGIPVFRWTSDLLYRESMVEGLACGLGAAMYVGHGRPIGWVGYYGLRKHHFDNQAKEPLGALLSLCCATASRKRTGLSFSESIPLQGIAAATFGAVNDTFHRDNTRWAIRISQALKMGVKNIGDLIIASMPPSEVAVNSYRIIGDPIAPIIAAPQAIQQAQQIKIYP